MKSQIRENGKKTAQQRLISGIIVLGIVLLAVGLTFKISALSGASHLSMMELLGVGILCSIIAGICILFFLPDHFSPLQNNEFLSSAEQRYGFVNTEDYQEHHKAISELRNAVSAMVNCYQK